MKTSFRSSIVIALLFTFFGVFLLYPLGGIVIYTLFQKGHFTVRYIVLAFSAQFRRVAFYQSFNIALCTTFFSIFFALPLSLLFKRYDFPLKNLFSLFVLVPLIVPPFVSALGLKQILGRMGSLIIFLLNQHIVSTPIDWLGSYPIIGVILLQTLHGIPILYLGISAAIENIDASLEESALVAGASTVHRLQKIIIPLLHPAIIASASLVAISALTDLGTPLLFELRDTLPVRLFDMLSDGADNPVAYSLVLCTAVFCCISYFCVQFLLSKKRYDSFGKGRRIPPTKHLSPVALCCIYLLLIFHLFISLLPQCGIILLAFSKEWFMTSLPTRYTTHHFLEVLSHPLTSRSFMNSTILSISTVFFDTILGFSVAYVTIRIKNIPSKVIEALSNLPLAIPGLLFAFSYLGAFSGTLLDPRKNPTALLIAAYSVRRLPAMVQYSASGLQQVSTTLEEAATSVGASTYKVITRITLPLMMKHIIGGGCLCFAFSMLEVSDSLLLAPEEKNFPIAKALYALSGRPDGPPLACALAVITTVVIAIFLAVGNKMLSTKRAF